MLIRKNADAIISSFQSLVEMYRAKMCTLEIARVNSEIPYRYEFGDTEGPYIDLYISVKRESARSEELKKKYKSAGMSSSV